LFKISLFVFKEIRFIHCFVPLKVRGRRGEERRDESGEE
jgi:hypothetical protein